MSEVRISKRRIIAWLLLALTAGGSRAGVTRGCASISRVRWRWRPDHTPTRGDPNQRTRMPAPGGGHRRRAPFYSVDYQQGSRPGWTTCARSAPRSAA